MCKVVVTILQEESPGSGVLDRWEKTEEHGYKSPAVVGLRADPTSDKINGKRRKEQGGVRSFR